MTFLFTDIVGSTRRWEDDTSAMAASLARHDNVVRAAVEAAGGYVFSTGGDGFAVAFSDAAAALSAATEIQQQIDLPVRMGLHTGTAEERDGNYFGPTLNRAARLMSAAHGGQVLLSPATVELVQDRFDVQDLGEHHLADLPRPLRIWQLGHGAFGPLRTADRPAGNLTVALDAFVGRDAEMKRLARRAAEHRLVTVVGVGGMGKTRLATETAARLAPEVGDGVWFVDLGVARVAGAVAEQIASALGVTPAVGQTIDERLDEFLGPRDAVLLLDNCEHVVEASAELVGRLLRASPDLRVIATSREPLLVPGEEVLLLDPLPTGPTGSATELFVERVRSERGSYEPDASERVLVADLCARLDGMPLAIELAAARARSLGVGGVLGLIDERFRLLGGGRRTGSERHGTLRATVDWSYDLLTEVEQRVFDRLGVFVGWFDLDDAIAVAGGDGLDMLDVAEAVAALVDKSMCTVDLTATLARYRYLETLREYAREHLAEAGELDATRTAHALQLGDVAARLEAALLSPAERAAADETDWRMGDLRTALRWSVRARILEVIDAVGFLAEVRAWQEPTRSRVGSTSWSTSYRSTRWSSTRLLATPS